MYCILYQQTSFYKLRCIERKHNTSPVRNALHEMPEVRGLAIGVSFGDFSDSINKPPNQRNGIRRSYKECSQNSDKPTKIVHRGSLPSG